MILTSTTLAGLGVVPAVTLDCGGKSDESRLDGGSGQPDAFAFGVSALPPDAGEDALTFGVTAVGFDGGFSVADTGFTVAATFDAASDGPLFTVGASFDASGEDAFGFSVAAIEPDAASDAEAADDSGEG